MKKILLFLALLFAVHSFAQADITVTNTDNQNFYVAGTSHSYSIVVTNNGPTNAANIVVSNPIPANIASFVWTGPFDASPSVNDFTGGVNTPINYTLANMTAGHVILGVLFGMAISGGLLIGWLPFAFTVAIYGLEVGIAFIQAYIFTILTCVYIGDAFHLHGHDKHAH